MGGVEAGRRRSWRGLGCVHLDRERSGRLVG
jgi:hypothetical protein